MNREIKIITLGDIFKNIETEEKAFEFLNYIQNLQQENEKLKDLCNKYEEEHSTAFKLWTMKMKEMPDYEEKMNYKSRIDKAIEYIEEKGRLKYNPNELINILKGDSE